MKEPWKNRVFPWPEESLLGRKRDMIDPSSADLDGSHTVARRGGEEVGGAAHKAAQTTNAIFIADLQGIPMAMQQPYKNDEKYLLDRELLSLRYSIERTNAWMDSFRSVVSTKRFPAGKGGISWYSM